MFFKSINKKIKELGFKKVADNKYAVSYERLDKIFGYTQCVDILHKASGRHILQSYDKNLSDSLGIGKH